MESVSDLRKKFEQPDYIPIKPNFAIKKSPPKKFEVVAPPPPPSPPPAASAPPAQALSISQILKTLNLTSDDVKKMDENPQDRESILREIFNRSKLPPSYDEAMATKTPTSTSTSTSTSTPTSTKQKKSIKKRLGNLFNKIFS